MISFEQHLQEMPLPSKWAKKIFTVRGAVTRENFDRMISYVRKHSDRIVGSGSSRNAYQIMYQGRPTILKVAKNKSGLAQNKAEIALMFNQHYTKQLQLFIPGIDYDKTSSRPTWIHMEMAKPFQSDRQANNVFRSIIGDSLDNLVLYAELSRDAGHDQAKTLRFQNLRLNARIVKAFVDFAVNMPEELGDYTNGQNWGLYNGKLVIIDAGLNSEIADKYYSMTATPPWTNTPYPTGDEFRSKESPAAPGRGPRSKPTT